MANFYVTNNRYPSNPQLFTVNLVKITKMGGEVNPNFKPSYPSAEPYWTLLVYTTGKDYNGKDLNPIAVDILSGLDTVQEVIDQKVAELCALIDWSQQGQFVGEDDSGAPSIYEQSPLSGETNVPINSPVVIRVRETLPGVGIDISTVSLRINGIQINPSVSGNKYDCTFTYNPRPIYY